MDHEPMLNIMPFGMCTSLANPTVASATSAAMGVLTPMPCIPATTSPWVPGAPTVLEGNLPTLDNTCKCMFMWGGVVTVAYPGQVKEMIPEAGVAPPTALTGHAAAPRQPPRGHSPAALNAKRAV